MKWIVVLAIMVGLFYLGKGLMPSATAIDTNWMKSQVKPQMGQDQVQHILGGPPSYIMKSGIGKNEVWYYNDRYDSSKHLTVEFIDGRVLRAGTDK